MEINVIFLNLLSYYFSELKMDLPMRLTKLLYCMIV